jgi:hypothetical protein
MYSAHPPPLAGAPGGEGGLLNLSRAGRRAFPGSSAAALDPMFRRYLSDMTRPYGLALREDRFAQGDGHSYGEMAEALLRETVPASQPVDLIVLAFAIPDVIPGRSTAVYLSHVCPGSPMAFAICDQGAAAAFTGLRVASAYARAGSCQRSLIMIVEQAALHYEAAGPATIPAGHAAVALLCDGTGPGRLLPVRQHADVAPPQAGGLLASELATLATGRTDVTVVISGALAASRPVPSAGTSLAAQVLAAPPGQPCTGVWWELAAALPGWTATGRLVVLADYDPALRYLCVAAVDVVAGPGPAPQAPGRQAQPVP